MKQKHFLVALSLTMAGLFSCSKDPLTEETTTTNNAISATSTEQVLTRTSNFFYGVSGQPLSIPYPYNLLTPKKQIEIIKSMGMNIYRFNAEFQVKKGITTVPYRFSPLKEAADAAKITLLPYFSIRTLDYNKKEADNYNDARSFGVKIGLKNKDNFTYYEVGNELDNLCIIRNKNYSGEKVTHYDYPKLIAINAAIKGMIDGIKYSDPSAKIVVNCSWMHYGFMDFLLKNKAKIDIIGWHWYSDMESAAKSNYGINDITQFLANRYSNKPIWFTEFNVKDSGSSIDEKTQQTFIKNFLVKCQNNSRVQAALVWELLDQPERSSTENNYGLITYVTNVTNNLVPKIFAEATSTLL